MRSFDLAGFAMRIGDLAAGIGQVEQALLDQAAQVIEVEARLAARDHQNSIVKSTLPHSELCDSIGRTVRAPHAHVGSNHPEMEYRELGSQSTHPRPLLRVSAFGKGTEIQGLIGDRLFHYLAGICGGGIRVQVGRAE